MNYFFLLLVCALFHTSFLDSLDPLLTPRLFPARIINDTIQFNLTDEPMPPLTPDHHIEKIPLIGYYGDEYLFRNNYGLIKFNKKQLPSYITDSINIDRIPHLSCQVILHGAFEFQDRFGNYLPQPTVNNMVFHSFAYAFTKKQYFDVLVPMGIFFANGVQPKDIGKDSLQASSVIVHESGIRGVPAFSPNNARFNITNNRAISTFWSIATSPDTQHATISYHILINSPALMDRIHPLLDVSETLNDFITNLQQASFELTNAEDQEALNNALAIIINIAGSNPLEKLSISLSQLQVTLQKLNTLLVPA
jgi:hypothetical protein